MAEALIHGNHRPHHCDKETISITSSDAGYGNKHDERRFTNRDEPRIGLESSVALIRLHTEIESVLQVYELKCKNERLVDYNHLVVYPQLSTDLYTLLPKYLLHTTNFSQFTLIFNVNL